MPIPTTARTGQGARRRADGRRTRTQLMDAAEELFAANGVEGVSIRSINSAAGLAPASVHYHFGDRDALVRAVIRRRGEALVQRQGALLDTLERRDRPPTAYDVVHVLGGPMFDLLRDDPAGGARWLAIIANLVAAHDNRVYLGGFGPTSIGERLNDCLAAAYPDRPRPFLTERWRLASTSLLQLLAGSVDAVVGDDASAHEVFATIEAFVTAGLDGVCGPAADAPS